MTAVAAAAPKAQPQASKETLADKLLEALHNQEDGDTTEIDPKFLPGPNAKKQLAIYDKAYDGSTTAERFTYGGQEWYAVTGTADDAFQMYAFFSKNDKPAGTAEVDF
jgi:hypothetical protein